MQANEIESVMSIWLESTIKAHDFIDKAYWQSHYDLVKDEYIPNGETYVFLESNQVMGFISVIDNHFIGALFVDNDHQGKGIGKKLIEKALKQYGTLTLAVYVENGSAVAFYKKMGFEVVIEQANEDTQKPEYIMAYSALSF